MRASIGRISNSLKCLPADESCTPGLLAVKLLLIEQLAQEQEMLRAMKPLATRLEKTKAYVADKIKRLVKVKEQLDKLRKDESALEKTIKTNSEAIDEMQKLIDEDAGPDEESDVVLAELLHLAMTSNNERAKKLAQALQAKQGKTARALFQVDDSEDEMEDTGTDPYMAAAGWEGGQESWDQMFSHIDVPAAPTASASKVVAAGPAVAKQEGSVRKTVDKIHKDQRGMRDKILAQAARNCRRTTGKPLEGESFEMGFPQIGENREDY